MALSLIAGPPNSGRAGEIRRRLMVALPAEPVLVVPTADDVARFERELCDSGGGVVGASVRSLEMLFEDVADAVGADLLPLIGDAQRRRAVALAAGRAGDERLRARARRPAFLSALEETMEDLQAGRIGPGALEQAAQGEGREGAADNRNLRVLASVYRAYLELCKELGRADRHLRAEGAIAGLRAAPAAWGNRPVFLYGFDDLSEEQLALVEALSAATTVVAAVSFEEDRAPLAARATLHGQLSELAAGSTLRMAPDPDHTRSSTLYGLERGFGEDDATPVAADDGLVLMESAGERAEAEAIGAEVARLLAAGVRPDGIAIALRSVRRLGPLYETVLSRLGIPVTVHAPLPLAGTGSGAALLALLRAAFGGEARDLVAYLRGSGRERLGDVDWIERAVRRKRLRSVDEAVEHWQGRELTELAELRSAGQGTRLCEVLAAIARRMMGGRRRRSAPLMDGPQAVETRAIELVARTSEELAEIPQLVPDAAGLIAELEALEVPLARGGSEGRVEVTSPYRLRAGRFEHVFVASLQEGEFPGGERAGGLLSDEERAAIGLHERADPEAEERYLFYVCLTRPTDRLYLSWKIAAEDGAAMSPSPFVEEIRELLDPPPPRYPGAPDPLLAKLTRVRGPGKVVLDALEAPTPDELGRALAARGAGADHRGALAALGLDSASAGVLAERLESARERHHPLPDGLSHPLVHAEIAAKPPFGASTLEEYQTCSYRWFVGHELDPESLDPKPEPLDQGTVVHRTLERLYREPPAGDPLPRPATLGAWRRRASELLAEVADEQGLGPHDAPRRAGLERMEALIGAFLAREAGRAWGLLPDPDLLEARFGRDTDVGALDLGGFEMRGAIDRIDVAARADGTRVGVIRDYKLSRQVARTEELDRRRKLQLQLYMVALRELWGIEPIGGLYEPLAATGQARPRGPLSAAEREGLLDSASLYDTDFLDPEELEATLALARERAAEAVEGMRSGLVTRNPLDGVCPRHCTFQSICRRERAPLEAQEGEQETGGAGGAGSVP